MKTTNLRALMFSANNETTIFVAETGHVLLSYEQLCDFCASLEGENTRFMPAVRDIEDLSSYIGLKFHSASHKAEQIEIRRACVAFAKALDNGMDFCAADGNFYFEILWEKLTEDEEEVA